MKARIAFTVCALLLPLTSGCAALSLFGETHTHTHHHHHDCNDVELQKRLSRIESQVGIQHAGAIKPVAMKENR